jgi:hypothetical protein
MSSDTSDGASPPGRDPVDQPAAGRREVKFGMAPIVGRLDPADQVFADKAIAEPRRRRRMDIERRCEVRDRRPRP